MSDQFYRAVTLIHQQRRSSGIRYAKSVVRRKNSSVGLLNQDQKSGVTSCPQWMSAGGWNFAIDQLSFSGYNQSTHETNQASLALHQTRILHRSTGVERIQD
jgi:hypothetical protein